MKHTADIFCIFLIHICIFYSRKCRIFFCIFNVHNNYNCIKKWILNSFKKILFFTVFQIIMYNYWIFNTWNGKCERIALLRITGLFRGYTWICFSLPHMTIDVGNWIVANLIRVWFDRNNMLKKYTSLLDFGFSESYNVVTAKLQTLAFFECFQSVICII